MANQSLKELHDTCNGEVHTSCMDEFELSANFEVSVFVTASL